MFSENREVYEIMLKSVAEPDRPQTTDYVMRRTSFECRRSKTSIQTHTQNV